MDRHVVRSPFPTRRPCFPITLWILVIVPAILAARPASAADFLLNAVIVDTDDRPQAGVKVALGRIDVKDTSSTVRAEATALSDATGKVSLMLTSSQSTLGASVVEQAPGRVLVPADGILRLSKGTTDGKFTLISAPAETETLSGGTVTVDGYFGDTGSTTYPPLETYSFSVGEGTLKLWKGYGAPQGPPALLIQGFSLLNEHVDAYEVYNAWFDLAQGLRQAGRDVWIVTFFDVRDPVAGNALIVERALETILDPGRGYTRVDVIGHSLGGLAGRYALAKDEQSGGASAGKVRIFASIDAPQQGMNVHVAVQAALWQIDPVVMYSPAIQNMLYQWVGRTNFSSDDCSFPQDGSIRSAPGAHDAFFRTLNALNGDGYPHRSRNIAVAAGGTAARTDKVGDNVYRLQASLDIGLGSIRLCRQDYQARALDLQPGAVFPGDLLPKRTDSGSVRIDLDTFLDPVMIPTASAIDWRDGASKFERFFLPELAAGKLLQHGDKIPGATEFLLWQLTDVATTVVELPPVPSTGWYRGPVTVKLQAASPYKDVTASEVSGDGGTTWTLYVAPLTLSADGTYRLLARSRVAAGNVEDPAVEAIVRIDGTAPTLAINAPEPRAYPLGEKVTITVAATDAGSGVAPGTLVVKLNGKVLDPAQPIALEGLAAGDYTVEVVVEDVAGNRATAVTSFTVKAG
jgi:hypothetical protein